MILVNIHMICQETVLSSMKFIRKYKSFGKCCNVINLGNFFPLFLNLIQVQREAYFILLKHVFRNVDISFVRCKLNLTLNSKDFALIRNSLNLRLVDCFTNTTEQSIHSEQLVDSWLFLFQKSRLSPTLSTLPLSTNVADSYRLWQPAAPAN